MNEAAAGGRGRPASRDVPLAHRLLLLGLALCAAELLSFYWKWPVGPRGVTAADWLDLGATYVVVLLYGWVLLGVRDGARGRALPAPAAWVLVLAGITWVLGRGVHVAANSLHDWIEHAGGADTSGLYTFWDETLGHLLQDAGTIGLAAGLTWVEGAQLAGPAMPGTGPGGRAWILGGAIAYGFIFFAGGVEGRTVPLTLPWSLLYVAWVIRTRRLDAARRPVRLFYLTAFATSLALFALWGAWHRGFPEFSATGLGPSCSRTESSLRPGG